MNSSFRSGLRALPAAIVLAAGCAAHVNMVNSGSSENTRPLSPPLPPAHFDVEASELEIEQDGAWLVNGEATRSEIAIYLNSILDSSNPAAAKARFRARATISGSSSLLAQVTIDLEIGARHLRTTGSGGAYSFEMDRVDGGVGLAMRRAIRKALDELSTAMRTAPGGGPS